MKCVTNESTRGFIQLYARDKRSPSLSPFSIFFVRIHSWDALVGQDLPKETKYTKYMYIILAKKRSSYDTGRISSGNTDVKQPAFKNEHPSSGFICCKVISVYPGNCNRSPPLSSHQVANTKYDVGESKILRQSSNHVHRVSVIWSSDIWSFWLYFCYMVKWSIRFLKY